MDSKAAAIETLRSFNASIFYNGLHCTMMVRGLTNTDDSARVMTALLQLGAEIVDGPKFKTGEKDVVNAEGCYNVARSLHEAGVEFSGSRSFVSSR